MLAGDFQRKLKQLNPRLKIYCGNDANRPASVFIVENGEPKDLCGVPKNWISEWPTYDKYGKMTRGGWRRVLITLLSHKLIDRAKSYKVFGNWELHRQPPVTAELSAIDSSIQSLERNVVKTRTVISPLTNEPIEVPVYSTDDVVDIGRMIAKDNQRRAPAAFKESGA